MQVHKFGGASVKDAAAIANIPKILETLSDSKLVLVISAMGKITNHLEGVVNAHFERSEASFKQLDEIKIQHFQIMHELGLQKPDELAAMNDLFVEAEWILEDEVQDEYDYLYDQIVVIGELLSSRIVSSYLSSIGIPNLWLDARALIITDESYQEAKVDFERTKLRLEESVQPGLDKGRLVITQGFIGGTQDNNSSTLGREGSDYTGAIIASCLGASSLTLWKNVPGILSRDPAKFVEAVQIPRLSYEEAIEMTYYGAKVIHPKAIKPLMDSSIPLYVKSFSEPEDIGTIISERGLDIEVPITVMLNDQLLIELNTKDHEFVVENHLSEIFIGLTKHHVKLHFMKNQAVSFSMVVDSTARGLESLLKDLSISFHTSIVRDVTLITLLHPSSALVEEMKEGRDILIEESNHYMSQLICRDESMVVDDAEGR